MKLKSKAFYWGVTLSFFSIFLLSCNDEASSTSSIALFVDPAADVKVVLSSGEKEKYDIEVYTSNDYVKDIVITSFDKQSGESLIYAEEINKKKDKFSYIYTAPTLLVESAVVTLTFKITDNAGNVAKVERRVTVNNKLVGIPEKTGIVLYSPFSGMPDALSLADVARPFILEYSPEPETADIYVVSNEEFNPVAWQSNTKAKFIRNNSFNYTEATAATINAVYTSSMRNDVISDIQPNDIIIVGHGEYADGVFLVTTVMRGSDFNNDYMILSYKGIENNNQQPAPSPSPDESEDSEEDV